MAAFDLVVIGTGPAGQKAAVQAAKLGKSVAICEKRQVVGGVCINTGTIPSKTFREAVLFSSGFLHRDAYAPGSGPPSGEAMTIDELLSRCTHVMKREIDVVRDQLRRNGITVLPGAASFTSPRSVVVDAPGGPAPVEGEYFVIAVGTVPLLPAGVPVDGDTVITSDGILRLKAIPRTLTVVGGGVIGTEYASMFAALGVEVTLIDRRPRLLEFVDGEISEALAFKMRDMNCTLRFGEDVASITVERPGRAVATLKSGKTVVSDLLLYALGRAGAIGDLNLPAAGLSADEHGHIPVDANYRTAVPHIFAAGDVIGFPSLASTSMEQGRIAACAAFGVPATSMPHLYPYGIYSVPEISMVGPTEEDLTKQGVPYEVGIARYREIARGAILGDAYGLLKILFHRETRKFLAVHIIGTAATELVHIGQAVLAFGGTIDYFVDNVFNYPTFAECYKVAALDGYNKIGPPKGGPMPPDTAGRKA
jgi:NAD(P) transhydrogenase